ncbi:PepSY domain-containing protein [Rubellimicrobium aerolatum]|uniref:PepSY domain-containing protein n=1 Tax=Rubellimicrobium aerolatum TaxID=490979 RepID=A0ABW0SEX6_9RHOB|nr:PepSY domain-containing protein [Rubellimicrobium aerolatum]MBP1807106.1 putative membrane protein YkoI [Rubellimicrobium aerolatum]
MRRLVLALLLLGPATASGQEADDDPELPADGDRARAAVARGEILALSELLPRLEASFPGEVLDIDLDLDARGRIDEYEFEVLTPEGRLIEVDMDAATGQITEVSDEDPDGEDD